MQWCRSQLPLLCVVLLVNEAHAFSLRRASVPDRHHALASVGSREDPQSGDDFADSETIEGPDCGNVKQIIGKWQKAGEIGAVAGEAEGTLSQAKHAVEVANDAADHAEQMSSSLTGEGTVPIGVSEAAGIARGAASDLTSAAADLEIEIGSFKAAMDSGKFGSGVDAEMLSNLKDKTRAVASLTESAHEAASKLAEKSREAQSNLKGSAASALADINAVLGPGQKAVEDATAIAQEAGFAVQAADDLLARADATIEALKTASQNAEEQQPVWEAAHDALHGRADGFESVKQNVSTSISEYESAAEALKTALEPLQEASKLGAGGDTSAVLAASGSLGAAEEALSKYDAANEGLAAQVEILKAREEALEKALKESEHKLKTAPESES